MLTVRIVRTPNNDRNRVQEDCLDEISKPHQWRVTIRQPFTGEDTIFVGCVLCTYFVLANKKLINQHTRVFFLE